jgi:hypothetical protein
MSDGHRENSVGVREGGRSRQVDLTECEGDRYSKCEGWPAVKGWI